MNHKEKKEHEYWEPDTFNPTYVFVSVFATLGGVLLTIIGFIWKLTRNRNNNVKTPQNKSPQ